MLSSSATHITSKALAFLLFATTIVVVPFVSDIGEVGAQTDFVPWECNGIPILMHCGIFHEVLPDPANPGELIIQAIPGTSGIFNSTAHDPITNLIYGVGNVNGARTVRAYDATGAIVFNTPITGDYPQNASVFAGTDLAWNAFDLERDLAPLSLTKELGDIPFDTEFTEEGFTIQVICTNGPEATDGSEVENLEVVIEAGTISVVSPVTVADLPVGEECTVAEATDEFFLAPFSPNEGSFTVSENPDDNAVTITNTGTDELFDYLEGLQPPLPVLAFTGRTAEELVRMALLLMAFGALVLFARRRREKPLV